MIQSAAELLTLKLVSDLLDAGDHVAEFLARGPAGGLAETAVGGEGEAVGGGVFEAGADT